MEGKVQVGGIKAPATRLKRRDLVQKLSKLEAKIAKLKELKKIEKCKRWCMTARRMEKMGGRTKSSIKTRNQATMVSIRSGLIVRKRTQGWNLGDNRDLKFEIETLKSEVVTLVHPRVILDKEISYK